jgi:hypothetical protein
LWSKLAVSAYPLESCEVQRSAVVQVPTVTGGFTADLKGSSALVNFYTREQSFRAVESSVVLRVFKRLWSLADEISSVYGTGVKIYSAAGLLHSDKNPLAVKLAQHASSIHGQLLSRLQRLEAAWREEESNFETLMAFYDFECYDVYSVVREMRVVEREMRDARRVLEAVSKASSALRQVPAEKRSALLSALLVYYGGLEARLSRRVHALESLYRSLYRLYENIFKPECAEYIKHALR